MIQRDLPCEDENQGSAPKMKTKAKTNGWWSFYKDRMSCKIPLAGEPAETCRKRIWEESKASWNSDASLRHHWRIIARDSNKTKAQSQLQAVVPKVIDKDNTHSAEPNLDITVLPEPDRA